MVQHRNKGFDVDRSRMASRTILSLVNTTHHEHLESYDARGCADPTDIERLKSAEVNKNSFTRFRVVRDGLARGWLDMIHCSRV